MRCRSFELAARALRPDRQHPVLLLAFPVCLHGIEQHDAGFVCVVDARAVQNSAVVKVTEPADAN